MENNKLKSIVIDENISDRKGCKILKKVSKLPSEDVMFFFDNQSDYHRIEILLNYAKLRHNSMPTFMFTFFFAIYVICKSLTDILAMAKAINPINDYFLVGICGLISCTISILMMKSISIMGIEKLLQINEVYKKNQYQLLSITSNQDASDFKDFRLLSESSAKSYYDWLLKSFGNHSEAFSCEDFSNLIVSELKKNHYKGTSHSDFGDEFDYIPYLTERELLFAHVVDYCKKCANKAISPTIKDYLEYTARNDIRPATAN